MKKILAIILIIPLLYSFYFLFAIPYETKELYMYVSVDKVIGFNITDTALAFGSMPPGAVGGKNITIFNDENTPHFVHMTSSGNITDWISVSDNNFLVGKNEEKNVTIRVTVPADAEFGSRYEGIFKIQSKDLI